MISEGNDHHLDEGEKVGGVRLPVVQVRQIYLAIMIHIHRYLYLHGGSGFDKTHGCILGMSVHQPNTNRNVVSVIW